MPKTPTVAQIPMRISSARESWRSKTTMVKPRTNVTRASFEKHMLATKKMLAAYCDYGDRLILHRWCQSSFSLPSLWHSSARRSTGPDAGRSRWPLPRPWR